FDQRVPMLKQLVQRFETNPPAGMPEGYLQNAKQVLQRVAEPATSFKDHSRDIYHADIQLRQFDKPRARFWALGLLGCGALFLIFPTALNVLFTLLNFLR